MVPSLSAITPSLRWLCSKSSSLLHLPAQVDLVVYQIVGSMHARGCTGNAERKIGELRGAILKHYLARKVGEHGLGIGWIFLATRPRLACSPLPGWKA